MTIQELAREAYGAFERITRPDSEERIVTIKNEARGTWVQDLVHQAHGDFLPDDWRYDCIHSALGAIADSDDPEDEAHEFADGHVDVYYSARFEWLSSNLQRQGYCDEAAKEFGVEAGTDISDRIGYGQYAEASEVFGLVLQTLQDRLDEVEEEEE